MSLALLLSSEGSGAGHSALVTPPPASRDPRTEKSSQRPEAGQPVKDRLSIELTTPGSLCFDRRAPISPAEEDGHS